MSLIATSAERGRFEVTVEIGAPYSLGPNEWVCPWRVTPFYSPRDGAHGGGGFQALCLAISAAKSELATFVSRGGRLQYLDDAGDFDLGPFDANQIILDKACGSAEARLQVRFPTVGQFPSPTEAV